MLEIVKVAGMRAYPPRATAFTQTFWNALRDGRLLTTQCETCHAHTFPPKEFCPHCWARQMRWIDLSGQGRLYAATTVHAAPAAFRQQAPYRVGIVDLKEGPRIAVGLWGATPPPLDAPVELIVLDYDDGPLFAARARE
jgi:uncharacterized OB-fold protein